jgi:CopG antitoxin of type II toxin-antitoxin system
MTRVLKPVPVFADEAEERRFWETHDSTEFVDWSRARRVRLPNLELTCDARANSASLVQEERK